MADDLWVARSLAEAGIPVFVSYGETPPKEWEKTKADPGYVDAWQEGRRLSAVGGQGIDWIDIDPRNGGSVEAIEDYIPESILLGITGTPSGGLHFWIRSLGLAKKVNFLPGVDYQGGKPDGSGRGFVYLPPTIRSSKVDNKLKKYQWIKPLDLSRLHGPVEADSLKALIGMGRTRTSGQLDTGAPITDGARNETLFQWGCSLRAKGFSQAAIEAALLAENQDRCDPPLPEEEVLYCARKLSERYERGQPPHIVQKEPLEIMSMADITEEKVDWLAEPTIARGVLTMITGVPGIGKSEFTLATIKETGCETLLLAIEDDPNFVVKPRFRKLGGDMNKLYVLKGTSGLNLAQDMERLESILSAHKFDMIVIDPVSSFMPGVETGLSNRVREVLGPLAALAARHNVAVLLVRHTNKRTDVSAIHKGEGSLGGFTGIVRSELLIEWEPLDALGLNKGVRVVSHIKSNLGPLDGDRRFTITRDPTEMMGPPLFEWLS